MEDVRFPYQGRYHFIHVVHLYITYVTEFLMRVLWIVIYAIGTLEEHYCQKVG